MSNKRAKFPRLRWPKIPLGVRFFLFYLLLVTLTAYFVSSAVLSEIKPAIRKATEETLVDMAHLLALMVREPLKRGQIKQSEIEHALLSFQNMRLNAKIWDIKKQSISHRIYITDAAGIVLFDSWKLSEGEDFSRWNDVYLTLKGQYGARSTQVDPNNPLSTVMHVAAPVTDQNQIIGVVTVAKANLSVQPIINSSKRSVWFWIAAMSLLALCVGALMAWRINSALNKLVSFADKIGLGERPRRPTFRLFYEYSKLSDAFELMRKQLDGKQYVETYVQTLTHELKSPLAAIKGAAEILATDIDASDRQRFTDNIEHESYRMQKLVDRLLDLARVEQQSSLTSVSRVYLRELFDPILISIQVRCEQKRAQLQLNFEKECYLDCDPFYLQQAILNLFENALDFLPEHGVISLDIHSDKQFTTLCLFNQGPAIPEYALPRLTEKFYSLPRPDNGKKSSGLGLSFVEQVAKLHHGSFKIENKNGGVATYFKIKHSL